MGSKSTCRLVRLSRFVPIIVALFAVAGLTGSTIPQTPAIQTTFLHHPAAAWSISTFTGSAGSTQAATKISFTSDSVSNQFDSYGSQQLQLSNRQESEGILYEDYRSRRSRMVICIEIAKRLAVEPLTLTDIALHTKLNFSQAKACLGQMIMAGLVQSQRLRRENKYALTRKGMLFLESGERTLRLLQSESIEDRSVIDKYESQGRTLHTY